MAEEAAAAPVEASQATPNPQAPAAAPEAPPTETTQQAAPPPSRETEALRVLMMRENQIQQREAALKTASADVENAQRLAALAKENPLQFLQEQGVSYDDVTKQRLAGDRVDPTLPLKGEIEELRSLVQEQRRMYEENTRAETVLRAQEAVSEFIESSSDYPLTKAAGMSGAVFDYLQSHYAQTNEQLSETQAAQAVEQQLSDLAKAIETVKNVNVPPTSQSAGFHTPTLTNEHAAQANVDAQGTILSEDDSLMQAAKMLRYTTE